MPSTDRSKVDIHRVNGLAETLEDMAQQIRERAIFVSHRVGEVYWSQSSRKADNPGGLPLFTGEHVAAEDYPALYEFITLNQAALIVSEADYNALVADTTKDVPFYMVKDGQIYLPILRHFIKNANETDGIKQEDAGLPNITGGFNGYSLRDSAEYGEYVSGAFTSNSGSSMRTPDTSADDSQNGFGFDASLSNSIYGNSDTVTPAHSTLFPWVGCVLDNTSDGVIVFRDWSVQ